MSECRVLLVGFEGFSSFWPNPAQELVESLDGISVGRCSVESATIPVKLSEVRSLYASLEESNYTLVLGVGLATKATKARLELAAVNLVDYDEGRFGEKRTLEPVLGGKPFLLPTGLPYRSIIGECRERGLDLRPGNAAGTYMCNALAYVLHAWAWNYRRPAGFIHVPPDTGTAMRLGLKNFMPRRELRETLLCIVQTVLGLVGQCEGRESAT